MVWMFLVYALLGVSLIAFVTMSFKRSRKHHTEKGALSLSDDVAVFSAILNVVLLIVAVAALHVAVTTYLDAKRSGEEQVRVLKASTEALSRVTASINKQVGILEKSGEALDTSVNTAIAQQKLLAQSVSNSRRQLRILQAQWVRELEQPDLRGSLYYPNDPSLRLFNHSKIKPARDVTYQLIAFNLDRFKDKSFQLVQTSSTSAGTLIPNGSYFPSRLPLMQTPNESLKNGDRIFGYITLDCPDCTRRKVYWFLITYGEDGWYRETKPGEKSYSLDKVTSENAAEVVADFMKNRDLLKMPKSWDERAASER